MPFSPSDSDRSYVRGIEPGEVRRISRNLVARLSREYGAGDGLEDAVQEAWRLALQRDPDRQGFFRWLETAARFSLFKARRASRARAHRERRVAEERPHHALPAEADVLHGLVQGLLRNLEGAQREPLELQLFEDLSIQEISRRLGRPEGTVRSQLSRGRARLRRLLESRLAPPDRSRLASFLALLLPWRERGAGAGLLPAVGFLGVTVLVTWVALGGFEDDRRAATPRPTAGPRTAVAPPDDLATRNPGERVAVGRGLATEPPAPEPTVRGRVVNSSTRRPVRRAAVYLSRGSDPEQVELVGRTDPDGRVTLPRLSPGAWIGASRDPDHPLRLRGTDGLAGEEIVLELRPVTAPVRGDVVDEEGQPVAGATLLYREIVDAKSVDGVAWAAGPPGRRVSSPLGRFSLPCPPGSGDLLVEVHAAGHRTALARLGREGRARIVLTRGDSRSADPVRGRVTDADGRGLAGVALEVTPVRERPLLARLAGATTTPRLVRTDERGAFETTWALEGLYLTVPGGDGGSPRAALRLDARPEAPVTLVAGEPRASVRGTVSLGEDACLRLFLLGRHLPRPRELTARPPAGEGADPFVAFAAEGLGAGTYDLWALVVQETRHGTLREPYPAFRLAGFELAEDEDRELGALRRPGFGRLDVDSLTHDRTRRLQLCVQSSDGWSLWRGLDRRPATRGLKLQEGRYSLRLLEPNRPERRCEIEVAPGQLVHPPLDWGRDD